LTCSHTLHLADVFFYIYIHTLSVSEMLFWICVWRFGFRFVSGGACRRDLVRESLTLEAQAWRGHHVGEGP
jgi:hypothetical protein